MITHLIEQKGKNSRIVEILENVKAAARLPQSALLPEFLICPNMAVASQWGQMIYEVGWTSLLLCAETKAVEGLGTK